MASAVAISVPSKSPDKSGWVQHSNPAVRGGRVLTNISVSDISVTDMPAEPLQLPLTPAVFFILFALADGEKHGYAIMQEVGRLSGDKVRMGPATLYTTIQRLLDLSLIEETKSSIEEEG